MSNKIIIGIFLIFVGYYLLTKYLSIDSNPCDLECDNCINTEQCLECYEQCYNRDS